MTTVGAFEAGTHLAKRLTEVEQRTTVTITTHGRPGATLVAVAGIRSDDRCEAVDAMRSRHSGYRFALGDVTIRELIDAGRT